MFAERPTILALRPMKHIEFELGPPSPEIP